MQYLKPIPKSSLTDPWLPMQYRAIILLSTVYKLYTGILNSRIVSPMETEDIYADEQNGFRPKRSCSDHLFTITSVISNRKSSGQATYVAYIDAEKAFDKIDREMLLYKAMINGLDGKMYNKY